MKFQPPDPGFHEILHPSPLSDGEVLKNAVSAGDVYAFQQRQGAWGRDAA